jgi:hypothetical protein
MTGNDSARPIPNGHLGRPGFHFDLVFAPYNRPAGENPDLLQVNYQHYIIKESTL